MPPRRFARRVVGAFLWAGLLTGFGPGLDGLSAQEVPEARVLAVLDFIAGTDLYLAVGTDHGIRQSDTLPVYDGEGDGAGLLGFLHFVSATEKRSVANVVGEPFHLERGRPVYLGVPADRIAETPIADVPAPPAGAGGGGGGAAGTEVARTPSLPVRLHGRVSLDYDAFRTVTRWGEDPEEEETRTFSTPTFRLQARAQNLPGGFSLNTGVRVAHRMSSDSIVRPVTSTRIYQFDLEKRFEQVPLEMHLGRFYSPFDEFSGFWDGLLLRVGPDGLGAGVAVGFEPRWSNEGFGNDRPKVSGFIDFDARGEGMAYSGSLTFLGIRPRNGLPDRTALGFSHRVRVGRAWIRQRVEVDQDLSGSDWNVTRLQLDGSLALAGGLGAFAGWRRWRSVPLWAPTAVLGPQEDRGHLGLSYWSGAGGGSVDLSLNRPEVGEGGRTVSGSFFLLRTPLPGIGVGGSASHWSRGDDTSLHFSPELRVSLGRLDVRGTHRYYRTVTRGEEVNTQFSDASLTLPLGAGAYLRLQGSTQWGGNLSSNRIFASIWKGF